MLAIKNFNKSFPITAVTEKKHVNILWHELSRITRRQLCKLFRALEKGFRLFVQVFNFQCLNTVSVKSPCHSYDIGEIKLKKKF